MSEKETAQQNANEKLERALYSVRTSLEDAESELDRCESLFSSLVSGKIDDEIASLRVRAHAFDKIKDVVDSHPLTSAEEIIKAVTGMAKGRSAT